MMKKISMYFTALYALLLVAACSTEVDKATDSPSGTVSQIRIGAFPAFEQEPGARAIGTPDPGKTAWAQGDIILLKLQLTYNDGTAEAPSYHTLTYSEATTEWTAAPALPDFMADYHYTTTPASIDVKAYYAPAYEWSTTTKGELALISGKQASTDEYLTYTATGMQVGEPIRIDFSAARPYSRLRIATRPGIEVEFSCLSFTPAGSDASRPEFITATSDDNGNVFFFGSWPADTEIAIGSTNGGIKYAIFKTMPASQAGKSYAMYAPNYTKIEVTTAGTLKEILGDRVTTMDQMRLTGTINAEDFKTMNTDMTALTHIDMEMVKIEGIDDIPDNTIPSKAFKDNTRIKHIVLPNSLVTISSDAFSGCSNWEGTLTIPEGVKKIWNFAFNQCTGLSGTLTIPESVTEMGDAVFRNCTGLTGTLTIPNSVTKIGNIAFDGCSGFTGRLTIPKGVTSIETSTFWNCLGFTAVTIPEGVTTISFEAFMSCWGLEEQIVLPRSITEIRDRAFASCTNVPSFKAQWEGADEIPTYAVEMLTNDKPIYIPAGTKAAYVSKGWPEDRLREGTN